jgi:hypothetical protein
MLDPKEVVQVGEFVKDIMFYAGITTAIVALLRPLLNKIKYWSDEFVPLTSFIVGILVGVFVGHLNILLTLMIGLVASGAYDLAKNTGKGVANKLD